MQSNRKHARPNRLTIPDWTGARVELMPYWAHDARFDLTYIGPLAAWYISPAAGPVADWPIRRGETVPCKECGGAIRRGETVLYHRTHPRHFWQEFQPIWQRPDGTPERPQKETKKFMPSIASIAIVLIALLTVGYLLWLMVCAAQGKFK